MMRAVEVLRDEHNAALTVLGLVEAAATAAEQGQPVPADIFADVQAFLTTFIDECHHHKEETAVFPRLLAAEGGRELVQQLEADHDRGRRLTEEFVAAVAEYRPGDAATGARLAAATRDYAAVLRAHIDAETNLLYPVMERELAHADGAIVDAFDRIELEEIGEGTHEQLHGMIDSLPGRIAPWRPAPAER